MPIDWGQVLGGKSSGATPTAPVRGVGPRVNWGPILSSYSAAHDTLQQAANRQNSINFVNSQKNAAPIKPVGTFGNTGFGGIASGLSNLATGAAKAVVSIPGQTAEGVLGTGSAGEITSAPKTPGGKTQIVSAGKNQSIGSQAAGALSARLLIAAPAEDLIKGLVESKVPGLAGKVTASAIKGAHQAGLVNASSAAAQPNATHQSVMDAYSTGALAGLGLGARGRALSEYFGKGATSALADARAAAAVRGGAATSENLPETQKLLGSGISKNANNSTTIIKGTPDTPATPTHVPVTDAEYTQRFNDLSKSYDNASKAAANSGGPLTQKIAQEHVDQAHIQQLDQLNHEFTNGKPNPDFQPATPGTPDKTVQTGFVMGPEAVQAHATATEATGQRAQVHQRIGQIDSIIKNVQQIGTNRSPADLRALMQERQAAQDVLDGKRAYSEVYGQSTAKQAPGGPPVSQGVIAHDYRPGADEGPIHTPIGPDQLHPGARNVFAETPTIAEGDTKGAPLNQGFVSSIYHNLGAQTEQLAKGLKPENIKLIDQIESDKPMTADQAAQRVDQVASQIKDPEQQAKFKAVVSSMKQGKDTRYLSDTAGLQRDMGYVQNHLTHTYEHTGAPSPYAKAGGTPGYANARIIATKAEADRLSKLTDDNGNLLYPHLKLADVNAVESHISSMQEAAAAHGSQAFKQGVDQAHPGAVVGPKENGLYSKITLPNGADISSVYNKRLNPTKPDFPYGVRTTDGNVLPVKNGNVVKALKDNPGSKLINAATGENLHSNKISRIVRSVKNDPLGAYDKANGAVKTSVLGGGTFHALTTAGTVAGQQGVRSILHPSQALSSLADNLKIVGSTFSKGIHNDNLARWEQNGTSDFSRKTGVTGIDQEIAGDNPRTNVPGISNLHDMIFKRQIPAAKLTIMQQEMSQKFPGMDFHNPTPEQLAYGRDVASAVNNLGGINRAVEGMSPKTARIVSRVVLAPDFTEGKFRTIGNALTAGGPKGNLARQMVVGKSVLFALPGLAALTAAGKINWNDPNDVTKNIGEQFLDPYVPLGTSGKASKTNPNGSPEAVTLPSTFVSELGKIFSPVFNPNGSSPLSGAESYATNREAALPAIGTRLAENKDFYGKPIYGADANGNPIGAKQTALNVAEQAGPIPAAQTAKQLSGQQSLRDTTLNTLGVRVGTDPTSASAHQSAGETYYFNTLNNVQKQKSAAVKQINNLAASQPNKAARLAQEWNDSIAGKFSTLRSKYPNYDPTQDSNYHSLKISPTSTALATRARNSQKALKVLSTFR